MNHTVHKGELRAIAGLSCALGGFDSTQPDSNHNQSALTMFASTSETKHRGRRAARGQRSERRTQGRLRDLCDEVLASYRAAQGQDLVTEEDRQAAQQVLRSLTPSVAR
jgi:hypothetical protein